MKYLYCLSLSLACVYLIGCSKPTEENVAKITQEHVDKTADSGTIIIEFNTAEEGIQPTEPIELTIYLRGNRKSIASESIKKKSFSRVYDNLEPGSYEILLSHSLRDKEGFSISGNYSARETLRLSKDESKTLDFEFDPLTPEKFHGDFTFSGVLKTSGELPASDRTLTITSGESFKVSTVTTDESGRFVLPNLASDQNYMVYDGTKDIVSSNGRGNYKLRLGTIEPQKQDSLVFYLPPQIGDLAPNVTFKRLSDLTEVSLDDFQGKVVVLDFWATWCGPCQPGMAEMNTYYEQYPDWKGKVELIALSLDSTHEVLSKHIDEKDWHNMYHAWCGYLPYEERPGKKFHVPTIPRTFIIDKEGIIREDYARGTTITELVNKLIEEDGKVLASAPVKAFPETYVSDTKIAED